MDRNEEFEYGDCQEAVLAKTLTQDSKKLDHGDFQEAVLADALAIKGSKNKKWKNMTQDSKTRGIVVVLITLLTTIVISVVYYTCTYGKYMKKDAVLFTERYDAIKYFENTLRDNLQIDKGTGCEVPEFDPFSEEMLELEYNVNSLQCGREDWASCYHSVCRVNDYILKTASYVGCAYREIIHISDHEYKLGRPVVQVGNKTYILEKSDHVKVQCSRKLWNGVWETWKGYFIGFPKMIETPKTPKGRVNPYDVLIFAYDSSSRNGFIRRMPKTYKYIKDTLKSTILKRFNVMGDGTPAALFPLLSGKNELEFPEVRTFVVKHSYLDAKEFIFHKVGKVGYRTAFFEDDPESGTFNFRFNGFNEKPADHYLRSVLMDHYTASISQKYCIGGRPMHQMMMDITDQFLQLEGKHFCLTFNTKICHDNYSVITTADGDTVSFLDMLYKRGTFNNTLLIFMGDHGVRFSAVRHTTQGRMEERLPLMTILLPKTLKEKRPDAQKNLDLNVNVLTTAHDLHTTILDILDLNHLRNTYTIPGADYPRGLNLLTPIPKSRSCSEAGIPRHFCSCIVWKNVSSDDRLYQKSALDFVDYINGLTAPHRNKCALRTLRSVPWVMTKEQNKDVLSFVRTDMDGYVPTLNTTAALLTDKVSYQLKVIVDPYAEFEVSTVYWRKTDKFVFSTREISRTTMYRDEPACISNTNPELILYCYCITS